MDSRVENSTDQLLRIRFTATGLYVNMFKTRVDPNAGNQCKK